MNAQANGMLYDPPGGWRYCFPKIYMPQEGDTLADTLLRDGYPQHEIDNGGARHCRFIGDGARDVAAGAGAVVAAPTPRIGDWIQVHSGGQAYPMDLRPSEIHIEDIAHSLAMQTRYTGHCLRFYSVAEHSVLMARWVPHADAMHALLHDASEAYLTDVPRPVKPFLPGYKEAERRAMAAVWDRFGLSHGNPYSVDTADARILNDERAQNMTTSAVEWVMPSPQPLGVTLQYWSPEQAKAEFLAEYWRIIETWRH